MTTTLVRVRLDNGMEASVPEDHAKNNKLKILDKAPAVDGMGNALQPTGVDDKLIAKREAQLAATLKNAASAAPTENV